VKHSDVTRWSWAEIDLDAYRHNVRVLRALVAPSELWAVVKANAYGHGAVPIARAALEAGATGLCVAFTDEGVELREGGVTAPILVFTEQPPEELHTLVHHGITPSVYHVDHVEALAAAARAAGRTDFDVHVKVDSGMHRSGADPASSRIMRLPTNRAILPTSSRFVVSTSFCPISVTSDPMS
jgi:alanine racemase